MTAPSFNELLLSLDYYIKSSDLYFQVHERNDYYFLSLSSTLPEIETNVSPKTRYVSLLSTKCNKLYNIITSVIEFYPLLTADPLPFNKEEIKLMIKKKLDNYPLNNYFRAYNFIQFLLIYDCPYKVIEDRIYYFFNKKDIELFLTDVKILFLIFLKKDFFLLLLLKQLTSISSVCENR